MNYERDIVVIGGSAGAFSALKKILPRLAPDLNAAVFVVLHTGDGGRTHAPDLLAAHSPLPVRTAEEGQPIERGTITFAPSDRHLLLGNSHVHLRRGPRENNFRPAIDPTFRSAAVYHSGRAIGVVLSGYMDDGAAGLRALSRVGAACIVQSPEDAQRPDMPRAALGAVPDAMQCDTADLAGALAGLVATPANAACDIPDDIQIELKIAGLEGASLESVNRLGDLTPYNCPDCNGVLWQLDDGPLTRFRCHTGHAFSMATLDATQEAHLERSLFDTIRAQRGRAEFLRRMASRTGGASRQRLERRATGYEEDSTALERIVLRARSGDPRSSAPISTSQS